MDNLLLDGLDDSLEDDDFLLDDWLFFSWNSNQPLLQDGDLSSNSHDLSFEDGNFLDELLDDDDFSLAWDERSEDWSDRSDWSSWSEWLSRTNDVVDSSSDDIDLLVVLSDSLFQNSNFLDDDLLLFDWSDFEFLDQNGDLGLDDNNLLGDFNDLALVDLNDLKNFLFDWLDEDWKWLNPDWSWSWIDWTWS